MLLLPVLFDLPCVHLRRQIVLALFLGTRFQATLPAHCYHGERRRGQESARAGKRGTWLNTRRISNNTPDRANSSILRQATSKPRSDWRSNHKVRLESLEALQTEQHAELASVSGH